MLLETLFLNNLSPLGICSRVAQLELVCASTLTTLTLILYGKELRILDLSNRHLHVRGTTAYLKSSARSRFDKRPEFSELAVSFASLNDDM